MSSSDVRRDVERYARECFAFLAEEKGFRRGRKEGDVWYTNTNYVGVDLGISVMVEYMDPDVQVALIRTQQGRLLPEWDKLPVSRRWSRPFQFAVQNVLQVADERLNRLRVLHHTPAPWTQDVYKDILGIYAGLVKDYLDALHAYPPEALFPDLASR